MGGGREIDRLSVGGGIQHERERELLTHLYPQTNSIEKAPAVYGKLLLYSSPPEQYILLGFFQIQFEMASPAPGWVFGSLLTH